MKNPIIHILLFTGLLLNISFSVYSQNTCIQQTETSEAWSNVPLFDGQDDYITIRANNQSDSNNASQWVEGSFTIDTWLYCTFPTDGDEYDFFSAGNWGDANNSIYMMFHKNKETGNWQIRVSDGFTYIFQTFHWDEVDYGLSDLAYNIDYENDYKNQWKHIGVTYDGSNMRLYIDGVLVSTKGSFNLGDIPWWHITIGDQREDGDNNANHEFDFRGYVSGFRIWDDRKLLADEMDYIYNKTFNGEGSLIPSYQNLYSSLVVNMYSSSSNIFSLVNESLMYENGLEITTAHHPALPPRSNSIVVKRNCESIELSWTNATVSTTNYIYRKLAGESGKGSLLCRTNDNSYLDESVAGQYYQDYEYYLETVWYNPDDPWHIGGYYTGGEYEENTDLQVFARIKSYAQIKNLNVLDDVTSGNCNGQVSMRWDALAEPPLEYYIYYKVDNGNYSTLINGLTETQYIHNVPDNELGHTITYYVDGGGDGCINASNEIVGRANKPCSTAPANLSTVIGESITLNWDFTQTGAPATAFRIYRSTSGGAFNLLADEVPIETRTYTDQDATMCTDYQYKVEAYNPCGEATTAATPIVKIPVRFDNVFTYTDGSGNEQAYFDASKGYYNQTVEMEWTINPDKKADVEEIEIYRRKPGQSYQLIVTLSNANTTNYTDQQTEANQMYEYLIRAIGHCSTDEVVSDSLQTLGFRNSAGIVSGKISFEGGNAVKDVEVLLNTDAPAASSSLYFEHNNILVSSPFPDMDVFEDEHLMEHSISFESWIRPELSVSGQQRIIFMQDYRRLMLSLVDMRPQVVLYDKNESQSSTLDPKVPLAMVMYDTVLQADTWYHLAFSLDAENGILSLYLNGKLLSSASYIPIIPWGTYDGNISDRIFIGGQTANDIFYNGYLDEMRLWQKPLSQEEMQRNYKRILTGEEASLIGYWRLDENYGSFVYDISKSNGEFNKNDLQGAYTDTQDYMPQWSSSTPTFEQLHPSGITDVRGNYIVNGIRYSGNGSIFNVAPILGVHEFDPTDVNLFISDNDPVHNNINFTDISSFRFTGSVVYNNTNFPVEGANIYIDNIQVFDAGGNPVQTDSNGEFEIQVPIGEHYITVKKNKHIFVNNGQWPSPTENDDYATHNFQDDVFNIMFYDSTRVKLAGRFVGDDVEGNKILGFGKSIANIGQGKIVLSNEQGFDITFNSLSQDTSVISFYTNNQTGEYEVWLLPEQYIIDSVANANYQIHQDDLGVLDLRNIPDLTILTDTIYAEEINGDDTTIVEQVDEYFYHFKRNFIVYSVPEVVVMGANEEPFIGEKVMIFTNPDTETLDTLDLVNESPFNYPLFNMTKGYDIDIRLQSRYYNYDENDTIMDVVPLEGAEVTISNNIEIRQPIHNFTTDADGRVSDYTWFRVGIPSLLKDEANAQSFTKTMTITASYKHFNVQWEGNEGNLYRAYVLGGKYEGGSNFVTYGPEIPEFVLYDPPGSNSYTYLEEGSGYMVSSSYNFSFNSGANYDNECHFGCSFEVGGGLTGPVYKVETKNDLEGGLESASSVSKEGESVESYHFKQRYETSSSPTAVGSMADVYIGRSYNMFFTETSNLRILPKTFCVDNGLEYLGDGELNSSGNTDYTLGIRSGFAATADSSVTHFVYSQDHILNSLLPEYRELIFELLQNSDKYESRITAEHPYYGTSNNAVVWKDTIAAGIENPSYTFLGTTSEIDTVEFLNQQISIWIQTIAANEMAKIKAGKSLENISIDGNVGAYTNEVSYTSVDKHQKTYSHRFKLFGGSEAGFKVNEFGYTSSNNTYMEWDRDLAFGTEEERTMTFGYVIDDGDVSDYYSIDVKMDDEGVVEGDMQEFINPENADDFADFHTAMSVTNGVYSAVGFALSKFVNPYLGQAFNMTRTIGTSAAYLGVMGTFANDIDDQHVKYGLCGSSPIFKIMGGKSSCPYEGPEFSMFYLNPVNNEPYEIHIGTQQREAPKIDIEPQTVVNVPDNQPATFELKLSNESMTGHDFIYELLVDETANPDGAILQIDGLSPNRPFFVQAGQTITKTLSVKKGASGVLDYVNLQLIFHSSCQFDPTDNFPDIADTATFSVHFIPACTEVYFENLNDDWVANLQNNDTIPLKITGYDINQASFEKIWLQYSQPGNNPVTKMTFYNNLDDFNAAPDPKIFINGEPEIYYDFDISSLNDGNYQLIAKSSCYDGSTYSEGGIAGIIDRISPRPYGTPQPADGILSPDENIKLSFNEDINSGDLYAHKDYISVRGTPNGSDLVDNPYLLHDASFHFDGDNDYLAVQNGINLDHTSFTIEFWAQRMRTGNECLVSLGSPVMGGVWIGFDENNHFVFRLGGASIVSDNTYTNTEAWNHYSCVYQEGENGEPASIILTVLADAENDMPDPVSVQLFASLEDILYAGFCPEDMSAFQGNMHELRVWNVARTRQEIGVNKSKILNGYEQGLYGLWPMNDAYGNSAKDIAFGRNAVVQGTWHVSRNGKSLTFDGASYAKAPAGSMSFSKQGNFTIEFWFKTQPNGTDMCFFSNGKGDGSLSSSSWTITATLDNRIVIENNGEAIDFSAENYLDNNWQHFAMSVNRQGYLSLFMNGDLIQTTQASRFSDFGSSHIVLGAKWYSLAQVDYFDTYFTGEIDELRIWNSALTAAQISRYMNHALQGDEYGLKAYYPFEDVRIEDPSVTNETPDNLTNDDLGISGSFEIATGADYTSESPNIKLHRPEVELPFEYVINEDELIIVPSMDAADIENTILSFSVKRVKDLNNNIMASTVSWSAFIDKNQLVWDQQQLNLSKSVDEELTISVNIQNKGGLPENYQIENIPDWMEVVPRNGSLNPLEGQEISITIKPSLNIGKYSRDIQLVSSMGFNERLALNIAVKGDEPDWEVNPDEYEYTASIIGQLMISDVLSTDTDDKVAAFIDGECRGVANVQYFETGNIHLIFMDVYDNDIIGNEITFKVYDAGSGQIYSDVSPQLIFEKNKLYGSVSSPLLIDAQVSIEQQFDLNSGWNWLSFNVFSDDFNDLDLALSDLNAQPSDVIKSQASYAQLNDNYHWEGPLNALNYKDMYKVKVSGDYQFNVSGARVVSDTVNISLQSGWNWIGFPTTRQISVQEAMSSISPSENDILKSQQQFAVFDPVLGWIGSLSYMKPGDGYMLYVQNPANLIISGSSSKSNHFDYELVEHISHTASNMTLIAQLEIPHSENYTLRAFNGESLVGVAQSQNGIQPPLFFLNINGENGQHISFEVDNGKETLLASQTIDFVQDIHVGELKMPYLLTFPAMSINGSMIKDQFMVYPNPTRNDLWLKLYLSQKSRVTLEMYNALGLQLFTCGEVEYDQGMHIIDLNDKFKVLNDGVYILKIKTKASEQNIRIIKQN